MQACQLYGNGIGTNTGTVTQSFSTPVKAAQFSFWAAKYNTGIITGSYTITYNDGSSDTVNISDKLSDAATLPAYTKFQKLWSPAKYVTQIRFDANTNVAPLLIDDVQLWEDSLPVIESDRPKIAAQVFRGVHPESEDAWTRGAVFDGSGSASTDGDILTLYFTGSSNFTGFLFKPRTTIDVKNVYKTLVIRWRGNASGSVFLISGSTVNNIFQNTISPSDWTIQTFDLSGVTANPIDTVEVYTGPASQGQFTQWDYIFFTTGSYLDVTNDFISSRTDRSGLSASTFNISLNNLNGKYTSGSNKINNWDSILIYGGYKTYDGNPINYEKIFGGRIEEVAPKISSGGSTVDISGRDNLIGAVNLQAFGSWGNTGSLFPPPNSPGLGGIKGQGVNPNTTEIARDVIDRFVNSPGYTSFVHPSFAGLTSGYRLLVDLTGSGVGNTNNTIGGYAQWYTGSRLAYYEVRNQPALEAVKELAEMYFAFQSTGSGLIIGDTPIQSLSLICAPSGMFQFGQIAQQTYRGRNFGKTLAIGDNIIDIEPQTDINNLKNLVDYYSTYFFPSDQDQWTENNADNWLAQGSGFSSTAVINDTNSMFGTYCISTTGRTIGGPTSIQLAFKGLRTGSDGKGPLINFKTFGSPISIPTINFWHRVIATGSNGIAPVYYLDIFAENANNSYEAGNLLGFSYKKNGLITGSNNPTNINGGRLGFPANGQWFYSTIYIGPYAQTGSIVGNGLEGWVQSSVNSDWAKITGIGFELILDEKYVPSPNLFYATGSIDGLNIQSFAHNIAWDSTSAKQWGLRAEWITDPIIKDSGSAILLAKADLYKFRSPIIRGQVKTTWYPTMHPEQLVTINYPDAGYYNKQFRIVKVSHDFGSNGFITNLEINSDTGSQNPLTRAQIIDYILRGAGIQSRSATDLMNNQFDPFLSPIVYDYANQ